MIAVHRQFPFIMPTPLGARIGLRIATIAAILGFIYCTFGCASTPRERYNIVATGYNATAFGLAVKHEVKPFPPTIWERIQTDEKAFTDGMAEANKWLIANPMLADTPGSPFPPLDTAVPVLNILRAHLRTFTGIITIPTSPKPLDPPATQPE